MSGVRTQANALRSARRDTQPKGCAAVTCHEAVTPGRIFCPNHWFFLPEASRAAIIATFRDAEWNAHQNAVRQAADFIDAAFVDARETGFDGIMSVRDGARPVAMKWALVA